MLYSYEKKTPIKIPKRKESSLYKIKLVHIIYWIVNPENHRHHHRACTYFTSNSSSFTEYLKGTFVLK